MRVAGPSRAWPAPGRMMASQVDRSNFSSRVGTFPRRSSTFRSGRSARSWERRLRLPVATVPPRGSVSRLEALRATRTSRGSTLSVVAASARPNVILDGRSFMLWTARSTCSSRSAVSIFLMKTPASPMALRGRSRTLSPRVSMISTSTATSGCFARIASATEWVCTRASRLPRVPIRIRRMRLRVLFLVAAARPIEVEGLVQRIDAQRSQIALVAPLSNAAHDRVQDLVHQALGEEVHLLAVGAAETLAGPFALLRAQLFHPFAKPFDDRGRSERASPGDERLDLLLDDGLRFRDLGAPFDQVAIGEEVHVVDVVKEDSIQVPDLRLEVPRDGDVDDKDGLSRTFPDDRLHEASSHDGSGGAGRADGDVDGGEGGLESVERHGRSPELSGQRVRLAESPVRDGELLDAALDHVPRGEGPHFPDADEQDRPGGEILEDLARQLPRSACDRHGSGAEGGLVPDAPP